MADVESSPPIAEVVEAELTWLSPQAGTSKEEQPPGFERGVRIAVGTDGRIVRVERAPYGRGGSAEPETGPPIRRFPGKALLPGFVNAHSHSFQRALRGRGETFPAGAGSFWSWREAMYELAGSLDFDGVRRVAALAFSEMRRAGITAVGEFHYLHHEDAQSRDFRFDEAVLRAAAEAGIRIVLLEAYYRTGGIGKPLAGAQQRFSVPDAETYWRQMDRLEGLLAGPEQTLGAVAHSIRAAEPAEVAELYAEARRRGMVLHMHVEEQRREIEACLAAYGRTPMQVLTEELEISPGFTAVHCTHTAPEDMERFLAAGGNVLICPLTEANLGDGIADLPGVWEKRGSVCLGSDSNARISMLEEMRWLEYAQRLAGERRGVLRDDRGEVAASLLTAATEAGARSLGLPAGAVAPGLWADFALVDLAAPTLATLAAPNGTLAPPDAEQLAAALVFGCAEEAVAGTCVGGRWQGSEAR